MGFLSELNERRRDRARRARERALDTDPDFSLGVPTFDDAFRMTPGLHSVGDAALDRQTGFGTDRPLTGARAITRDRVQEAPEELRWTAVQAGEHAPDPDDWWPDLPWWLKPMLFLVAFALIAGQIGKLFDFRVR